MKIFYDYQALLMQKFGGVSRYFYQIIFNIKSNIKTASVKINCLFSKNYYFKKMVKISKFDIKRGKNLLNDIYMSIILLINKFDIIHPTYYSARYLFKHPKLKKNAKIVVTVHDMIHEKYGIDDIKLIDDKKKILSLADGIICVSEYTKRDLLEIMPELATKKIKVIYHGNSMIYNDKIPISINLPENYILFVGVRDGYKNFEILINAFSILGNKYDNLKVLCIGGGNFKEQEINLMKEKGVYEKFIQMNVSDNDLYYAYKNARCFIFPSKYEGFGIPILEAFYAKCPVIVSNCSCFPEIAENAALFFDAANPEDLSEKINLVLNNMDLKNSLIEKGTERLKYFSWDKAYNETYNFYEELISNKEK